MIEQEQAAIEIRRLSRLKGYPRSWGETNPAAAQQDAQAEMALIQAAAEAPDVARLRRWVSEWERRHVDAPTPAVIYGAWRSEESGHFDCLRPAAIWDHERGEWRPLAMRAAGDSE